MPRNMAAQAQMERAGQRHATSQERDAVVPERETRRSPILVREEDGPERAHPDVADGREKQGRGGAELQPGRQAGADGRAEADEGESVALGRCFRGGRGWWRRWRRRRRRWR